MTSAIGGALEIIDETCGVLVPPGDVEALSEVLGELVSDASLRERFRGGGPVRSKHLCDPAAQLSKLHKIFEQVALVAR